MTSTSGHLEDEARAFVSAARRATLGTIAPDGRPRLVPVCFVLIGADVFIAIDDKPKRSADPLSLARVRDILARPTVTLLIDAWDEDWSKLAWVRIDGAADLLEPAAPGHDKAVTALRTKYPQYAGHAIDDRPLIRIAIERVVSWTAQART
jgi:PPOX class probable F420-dependent enzyme